MIAAADATRFRLRSPVMFRPERLGGFSVTLKPGTIVHLINRHSATRLAVSLDEAPEGRIADDTIYVAASEVEPV